ncbi:MAG TPA: methylmalonyl-CoA mutase family protein, partial [Phenylobacterium sp.]
MDRLPPLASGFPPADEAAWRALVAKTLKDRPAETLNTRLSPGVEVAPLYVPDAQAAPLIGPRDAARPWDVRTLVRQSDLAQANQDALEDLAGGAASVILRIDPAGENGVAVASAEGLAQALQGVVLELAPVGLDAGFLGPQAADWLHTVAKSSPAALLQLHLDPLSAFAGTGASPGPVESHLISAANVAARLAQTYPKANLFMASGRVVHEAGGDAAGELAFAA